MLSIYYVGMDVHKKTVAICAKTQEGEVVRDVIVEARRKALTQWLATLDRPWVGAMEATLFTGWICDFLKPHARELKVAHPLDAARRRRRRTTGSMRRRSPTSRAAICCPTATWRRRSCASCGACCVTET